MTTPPWESMQWGYDKRLTHQVAAKVGIEQPHTFLPANRGEVAALECEFPVVLKPAFKQNMNPFTYAKAWRADNVQTLLSCYDDACRFVDPSVIMIQEFIPGDGEQQFSYAALCADGVPLVSLTARRTRQYPLDFGRASTFVESVDLPQIEEPSRRLLKEIGSMGLVELEYKRNVRTGSYQLLDINCRMWGWHTLGRKAGVDFPYHLWQIIHGEPLPELRARSGVRWVRMLTDLQSAAAEIRRGRMSLWQYMQSLRGPLEFAIFSPDDPLPALLDVPYLASLAWKRKSAGELKTNSDDRGDTRGRDDSEWAKHRASQDVRNSI